ncbi:MAG: phage major capsid protein [Acidaminococcus sp.]|nr:phage major capsid protein [Acidaminococcus sp.]MDY4559831.1 phage major capsid protein [Eubacteriales bacterium]MDY5345630.1 phage major capsid protein [Eubacteriales bacterium]
MVTIQNAENALKTLYLGVLAEQLNVGVNPLLAKIEQTTADVWGKEIVKLAPFGVNGGVGAGTETGNLPNCAGNNYAQFKLTLKNFFGNIEISDKAMRASQSSEGAFVNLLNSEMDGLLKSSKFNFGRMLYGDGSGLLATTVANTSTDVKTLTVDSVKNLMEGMVVDVYDASKAAVSAMTGVRIVSIDRAKKQITLSGGGTSAIGKDHTIYVQGSKGNELTGLEAIFGTGNLYGLSRSDYSFLNPYSKTVEGDVTTVAIQAAIDYIEEMAGGTIDFIVSSYDVRRKYLNYLSLNRTNLDYMNLDGGYKAISYSGIPFVADRFVADDTMYLLNTADFKLHQLCDWRWIEGEGGTVLHQVANKAIYTATLVKYADLLCERPMGQAKIKFVEKTGA